MTHQWYTQRRMCVQICTLYMRSCGVLHHLSLLQDNDLEREFQVHRTDSDYALAEFWKWVIAFMIGLSMGCIGFAVDWGITLLHDAKYQSTASVLKSSGNICAATLVLDHTPCQRRSPCKG